MGDPPFSVGTTQLTTIELSYPFGTMVPIVKGYILNGIVAAIIVIEGPNEDYPLTFRAEILK